MLETIWLTSILLSLLSVLGMLMLIIYRIYENEKEAKFEKRKKQIINIVFECSEDYKKINSYNKEITKKDADILINIARDLLPSLTGKIKENIVYILTVMGALNALLEKLKSSKEGDRILAIDILTFFKYEEVEQELFKILKNDVSSNVRLHAAMTLNEFNQITNLYETIKFIFEKGAPSFFTFKKFMKKIAPKFVDELIEFTKSGNKQLEAIAAEALGYSEVYEVLPTLIDIAKSNKDKETRLAALRSLWILEHPKAEVAVVFCLDDDAWEIRAQACKCAGKIGFLKALDKLENLLSDDFWWVRYRAAEALTMMGEKGLLVLKNKIKSKISMIDENDKSSIIALATEG